MLQAMLLLGVAECSTPDKQPTMLSHEAFARAEVFINETARPLERTLFAFHFTHGNRDAVTAELAKFQNNDGGFASCLESDTRWCGSSPLGAMKALRILTDVGAPADDPAQVHMKMPDIESLIELVRLLPPGQSTEAVRKLKRVLAVV